MAITFPKKKVGNLKAAAPVKKVAKAAEAEEEEVEETAEEEAEEEEDTGDEAEEAEDTEEEEEVEESEEESDEEDAEDDEAESDDEEEEEEEKPVKKAVKIAPKKAAAPAKKAVAKAAPKKTLKTGSLASFGQKASASRESFSFELNIGDETAKIDVPGKKPEVGSRLSREQLVSILAGAIKAVTGNDCSKKDAELLFNTFEGVMFEVTENWSVAFMKALIRNIPVNERVYPLLKGSHCTLVPAHRELRYRRVCDKESAAPIKLKTDKKGQPITDKKGNYIPVEG